MGKLLVFGVVASTILSAAPARPAAAANEAVVVSFLNQRDQGAEPSTGLTRLGGKFYGMTSHGGSSGFGTIYETALNGHVRFLHSFPRGPYLQYAPKLVVDDGVLYGTTAGGGGTGCKGVGCGTVFSITPDGVYTQIYAFQSGTDGAVPTSLIASGGMLYGTTSAGGAHHLGTVFSLTPSGQAHVIYAFKGGADGAMPNGLAASGGMLYGNAIEGGNANCNGLGCGTVFSLTLDGVETTLHRYEDYAQSYGNPIVLGGNIYGTTLYAGSSTKKCVRFRCGSVFHVTTSGIYTDLHAFTLSDGSHPYDLGLVGGVLYGAADDSLPSGSHPRSGEIFSVTRNGKFKVVYRFKRDTEDGREPVGPLIEAGGMLYGTTTLGGKDPDGGTIFSLLLRH